MAKVTTKADLTEGTEYDIDLVNETVTINVAGNITSGATNGVSGLALYSSIADWWKSDADANKYEFPFYLVDGPIGTMLEMREDWEFAGTSSIALLRDMGFAYKNAAGTITAEYANFVQGGSVVSASDQPYYRLGSATTPTDFGVPNMFNECIQIFGDSGHGSINNRSAAKFYIREASNTYAFYDLVLSQSLSATTYRSYLLPMSTRLDTNIAVTSPSGSPYSGMTLTLGATTNTINSTSYNFAEGEIDANVGTVQQVYDWFQNLLLSTGDIDSGAGTQRGDIYGTGSLSFAGGIITTSQGLTIKNIAPADASNIIHVDDTGTERQEIFQSSASVTGMPTAGAEIRLQIVNTTGASSSAWAATTPYVVGDRVLRSTGVGTENVEGLFFRCSTAGTSGGTEPTWDTTPDNTTNDGTVVWTTVAVQQYSDDPASSTYSTTYVDGEEYVTGDVIRIRFAELDGSTSFKIFSQNVIAASTGWTVPCDEVTDSVYASNAIDGSTITKFSADFIENQIDLVVATNFTAAEAYAFYCYQLTTSQGIDQFWGGVDATDVANYKIITSVMNLYLDNNTTATQRQTDTARIYRDDDGYPVKDPSTSGFGIDVNWKNVVYVQNVGGSSLTAGESAALTNINSLVSSNLDEQTSKALTTGKFLALK